MTPAWPWALALTIALGALIVSQVQLREARGEVHRLRALLSDVTKGTLRQLEQAEAAIARVRELHHSKTHNTQWLDDDADQCEYKRMVVAEAATSAVREACDEALHEDPMPEGDFRRGYNIAMKVVSRLLDGAGTDQ